MWQLLLRSCIHTVIYGSDCWADLGNPESGNQDLGGPELEQWECDLRSFF